MARYALCLRCRWFRDRIHGFRVDVDGTRDRTCRICRGEMRAGALVRCALTVPAVPLVEGRPVLGFKAHVPCAALVFRGRETEHLAETHATAATPELVERSFSRVGGGEDASA